MFKYLKYFLLFLVLGTTVVSFSQQPFTAGNIVVYRVGDGSIALSSNTSNVYLDEYTPSGTLVQSILMPTAANGANQILTSQGSQALEGMMNLSADGRFLVLAGSNAPVSTSIATARIIGLVDFNGVINTSTAISDYPFTPRSATSSDGNDLWFSGSGAIRYTTTGSTTSVLLSSANSLNVTIAGGQLFASAASPNIGKVGAGLPTTTGQTVSSLPGLPSSVGARQFAFADLDPTVSGPDVLYISDRGSSGGIRKYSLVGGSWVDNGVVGTTADAYTGLTVRVSANTANIFAVRRGANSSSLVGGELVRLTDNSGYNGTLTGTPTVIATVSTPNNMAFRGVALVPQPAPFTAGNVVVCRVGDGSTALSSNTSNVYLDEYTPSGTLVQSILMPTAANGANQILTSQGSQALEGMMNLSANGRFLVLAGSNAPVSTSIATARIIGLVDFNGVINTSTAISDYPFTPRSATSSDGNDLWFSGSGAIRYTTTGSTTSVLLSSANSLNVTIAGGQLFASAASPNIGKVGAGLPTTTGQTVSSLPGLPSSVGARQFAFADLDPTVSGPDVLYISDRGSSGGIRKYSLVGGSWVDNGVVGTTADAYTGLTVRVSANTANIFAVRRGANSSSLVGGELVRLTDNSGYNGTLTGTPTVIAAVSTPNNMAFRGVANVPQGCRAVTGLQAFNITPTAALINWSAVSGATGYQYAVNTIATPPGSGTATANTSVPVTGLSNGVTYYAHVRTSCSATSNSEWSSVLFTTGCKAPPAPAININISNTGVINPVWNQVYGAVSYEYSLSLNSTPPASGTTTSDTSFSVTGLNSLSTYYVHVRSNCGGGAFSSWTTKAINTACFSSALNLTIAPNNSEVSWNKLNNVVKYEWALTYSGVPPLSGTFTTDTTQAINNLEDGRAFYMHVRSVCTNGSVSNWYTVKFNQPGLEVYPNPVKASLNIHVYGKPSVNGQLTIADAMGRVVSKTHLINPSLTIDTRSWAAGMYLLRFDDGKDQYTVRVIKK